MKFLVVGATGFVGQSLCKRLIGNGHQVSALVRDYQKATEVLPQDIDIHLGDLISLGVDFTLPRVDIVVYLAASRHANNEEEDRLFNYHILKNFVEILKSQTWVPQRFIYASALAACGPSQPEAPLTEADVPAPQSAYGRYKLLSEKYLTKQTAFPITTFRAPIVLGSGNRDLLPLFKMACKGVGFAHLGRNQYVSFIDIEDVVDAIMQMSRNDASGYKNYFIAYPKPTFFREIFRTLAHITGHNIRVIPLPLTAAYFMTKITQIMPAMAFWGRQWDKRRYQEMAAPAWLCASDTICNELGWVPRRDIKESLKNTYQDLLQNALI